MPAPAALPAGEGAAGDRPAPPARRGDRRARRRWPRGRWSSGRAQGCAGGRGRATRRSPRLLVTSACSSSRMTVSRSAKKRSASGAESSSAACSGVVSRMSGGFSFWRWRLCTEVSPVRVSSRTCRPDLGDRLLEVAGDIDGQRLQRRDVERVDAAAFRPVGSAGARWSATRLGRKPASVLPAPVGAISRVERPALALSSSSNWCGRGAQPRAANQAAKGAGRRPAGSEISARAVTQSEVTPARHSVHHCPVALDCGFAYTSASQPQGHR